MISCYDMISCHRPLGGLIGRNNKMTHVERKAGACTRIHIIFIETIMSCHYMRWGWLRLPTLGNRTSIPSERRVRSKYVMRARVPPVENSGITEVPQGTIVGSHMEAILYKDSPFLSIDRIDVNHCTDDSPQMCIVIVDSMLSFFYFHSLM